MGLRLPATVMALACVCALLPSTSARDDDSFLSENYSQDVLRKLELEILGKTTRMQPLDYMLLYVIELKQGMSILNDTVTGIGQEYHDLWKQEVESMDRESTRAQCSCDNSDSGEVKELRGKVDRIQEDVQLALHELRLLRAAPAAVCEPRTSRPRPSEPGDVIRPTEEEDRHAKEELAANEAVSNYKGASSWKSVKKNLANVLKKTSPASQQLQKVGPKDKTPLNTMAQNGYTELLEELLNRGLPVDAMADDTWRYDILAAAAINGKISVVDLLLRHGASTESTNNRGVTPLMFAASRNHLDVVKELVRHNADVCRTNNDGNTALDFAQRRSSQEVVEFLSSLAPCQPRQ